MALRLGSLYVTLSAQTDGLTKGLADAMKSVEKFSKEAKRAANDVAQVAGTLSLLGGAAVKLASTVDGPTKRAVDNLENSTKLLAVQVADMLIPAVNRLAEIFRAAATAVASLDPGTKRAIASFATFTVGLLAFSKAAATVSSTVATLAGALKSIFGAIASIGIGPLLGIAAAIAGVIALVALLHRAWRRNWGGIQEATGSALNWLREAFSAFGSFVGKFWGFLVSGAEHFVMSILDAIDAVQKLTGKQLVDTGGMREGFAGMFKDLRSGAFFSEAFKFGKTVGEEIVSGIKEEWQQIAKELGLSSLFAGFKTGKPIGLGRGGPSGPVVSGSVAASAAMRAGKVTIDTTEIELALERSAREIERASNDELRARFLAEQNAQKAAKLAAAQATGNLGGLTKEEIERVTRDTGGAWKDLGEAQKTTANAFKRMGDQILNSLGSAGAAVQNVISAATTAGPVGAIIAGGLELLARVESFGRFLQTLEGALGRIGEFLNALIAPILDAAGAMVSVVIEGIGPLITSLAPLFEAIALPLKQLTPTLALLGLLFAGIAPILESVAGVLGAVFKALEPLFRVLFTVVRIVLVVIMGFLRAIIAIWNVVIEAIAAVVQVVLTAVTLGIGWRWAKEVADGIRAAKADDSGMVSAMDALATAGFDSANATDANAEANKKSADATNSAAEAAQKAAEALSNIPSGYKIALARFNAAAAEGSSIVAGGAGAAGRTGSGRYSDRADSSNQSDNAPINVGTVVVQSSGDAGDTWEAMRDEARKEAARRRGNPYGRGEGL